MNYLLFNNEIMVSDGTSVHRIDKGNDYKDILGSVEEANLCVVDVDVLIAAAVESPVEKKDSILVRKFKELYQHEAYIIQDERIDNNLFQVMGIKEQKVREVYSFIPPSKVRSFIPYGIALRNTLVNKKIYLNKTVVFVDDWGRERLLTVFDGLKFSRTRVIVNNGEDILPEIKRSQIDFFKKNEEYLSRKSTDFIILVNNHVLASEISKNKENLPVECLDVACPALEGLKETNTPVKFRLPEEIIKKRREIELKKNAMTTGISLCVAAVGLFYFLFNKLELGLVSNQRALARQDNERLDEKLKSLDRETYREDLRKHKSLNYGVSYLAVLDLVPSSYEVDSFKFIRSDKWDLEVSLSSENGKAFDPIPKVRILKTADIKDVFVNNLPGKHLRVTL
ncbi:MAG: hypothetical protein HQL12_01150 [Candidatus Omnitrophica bacterium]|nr:hypothetical protein [Candidatus Omnitrophota bacterium]